MIYQKKKSFLMERHQKNIDLQEKIRRLFLLLIARMVRH
jgi:hypothetical protein